MTDAEPVGRELQCDVLVAGGGINGVAIARDAAGRGLATILCEQDDLASHTSSASTKLIHGGLRYLEHGDIGLVRKALQERELLLHAAPHLVRPLRLLLVHDESMRPAWVLRGGLWLYDLLAGRSSLPPSRQVKLADHPAGAVLRPQFRTGFEFSDAVTDDARLVVTAAIDAVERGALILTRTRLARAHRDGTVWMATATAAGGREIPIRARALVNATGPWAASFLQSVGASHSQHRLRLVKGSHLVARRCLGLPFACVLQSADRRIAFVIPYEQDFTLIGTTEVDFDGDPRAARIDQAETSYLLDLVNRSLRQPIREADIVWSFAGVRPLLGDGGDPSSNPSALTRDFVLEMDTRGAPLLTIWGGKITTFRTLAEHAVDRLGPLLNCAAGGWTRGAVLPGGDLPPAPAASGHSALTQFADGLIERYRWAPPAMLRRMASAYGSRTQALLGSARSAADLGESLADGLYEAELEHMVASEWAASADDALWRRSKLGLHLAPDQQQRVRSWIERRLRS